MQEQKYPVTLNIEYPERTSRLITLFRFLLVIPALIIFGICFVGFYFVWPFMFLIVTFTKIYPRWMFRYFVFLHKKSTKYRHIFIFLLINNSVPAESSNVNLDIVYPKRSDLVFLLPLIKFVLVIPHMIVLYILSIFGFILYPIVWIVIIIIGRYPKILFDFYLDCWRSDAGELLRHVVVYR